MLDDIEKNTVAFQPNYDDRLQEPTVLPSRIPNLLVNGSGGIAVGMATNIPPHKLREVAKGVELLVDNPDATIADLRKVIPGPDFPTGGYIYGVYAFYCGNPWLLGVWDHAAHAAWPPWLPTSIFN
jgi:DNA gyrase subunit A